MATRPRTTQLAPTVPFNPAPAPGFLSEVGAEWRTGPAPQFYWSMTESLYAPEEGYNPRDHMSGYEEFASDILKTRSRAEVEAYKQRINRNRQDRELLANGEWGLLAGLAAGALDPLNLIPIPLFKGYGLVQRAARTGAANAAVVGGSALAQQAVDPLITPQDIVYQTGAAAVLGGAFGAIASRGRGASKALERMDIALSREEQGNLRTTLNVPREARAADLREGIEGLPIEYVSRDQLDEAGMTVTERVVTRVEPVQVRTGPDGQDYFWRKDLMRWVEDVQAGDTSPRTIPDDIAEALGAPAVEPRKLLQINEVANRAEFKAGGWKEKYGDTAFRDADEYMTFKGLKALYEDVMVRAADESQADFKARAEAAAFKEFNSSKTDASAYSRVGLEEYLDKLNRSPVAKAVRLAVGDNYLTNLPLQIAGDYGWAIRQNALGYRTKPSVLVRTLRHNYRFKQLRAAVDHEWNKYVNGQEAKSREILGQNVGASMAAWERGKVGQAFRGEKVIDYDTFLTMVGKATFTKDDFQVNGFDVPKEARAAAEAWNKLAREYDREATQHGVFYNQQRMRDSRTFWQGVTRKRKDKLAHFLWDETTLLAPGTPLENPVPKGSTRWYVKPDEAGVGYRLRPPGEILYVDVPIDDLPKGAFKDPYEIVTPLFQSAGRGMVVVDISGTRVPFYVSTGKGGKKSVKQGSWQPFFGFGPDDGWLNKGSEKDVANYYGVPILRKIARTLDDRFGDIRDQVDSLPFGLSDPTAGSQWMQDRSVNLGSLLSDLAPANFGDPKAKQNIAAILSKLKQVKPGRARRANSITLTESQMKDAIPFERNVYGVTKENLEPASRPASKGKGPELVPAIRIDGQIFTGSTHEDAIAEMIDALGETGVEMSASLRDENFGYASESMQMVKADTNMEGIQTAVERITSAAVKVGDEIYTGPNHFDAFLNAVEQTGMEDDALIAAIGDNGDHFLTSEGRFVTRVEADAIAKRAGQLKETRQNGSELIAEDINFDFNPQAGRNVTDQSRIDFLTMDELIEDRFEFMKSEEQFVHAERLLNRAKEAEARVADIEDAIEWGQQTGRHKFQDEKGALENYFPRNFDKVKIAQHREAFTNLIKQWYLKTGPAEGAEARARKTVHNILNGKTLEVDDHIGDPDGSMPKLPGLRHLMARRLDMPNSFTIADDELGDVSMADFIDTNILSVAEAYTRKMGAKIETAKMFGDAGMEQEIARVQQRMDDLGWDAAKQEEYLNHLRLTRDATLGTWRDTDPWRFDNRAGRALSNMATLAMMGRGLLASLVEVVRPGMLNGFDTQYRAMTVRFLSDMEKIKGNTELSKMTGELLDMVKDRFNARVSELNQEQNLGTGGSAFERWLDARIPGFFKINGMTPWTMVMKDIVAFSSQHRIMDDAIKWSEGKLSKERQMALSSIGIDERGALLLAKMPIERYKDGTLILPNTGAWTGTDGQRAMDLLLDGLAAQMRRGVVTPSFADKSTMLGGVLTNSRGAKRDDMFGESDLYRLPFQFMGYGLAANQKVLMSGLQGRDANFYSGALMMVMIGMGINYLKTPTNAWANKTWAERWLNAWETGGVGGFWLGDLNTQIEHYTANQIGIRPALGMKPKFGRTGVDAPIDIAGPGVAQFFDIYRAFSDPEFSNTARAQAIRRVIPYNNVLWWASVSRDTATMAGENIDLGGPSR